MKSLLLAVFFVVTCDAIAADFAPLSLVSTISLPGVSGRIDHFAMDGKGHRLFMAALGNDTVEVIDVEAGKRLQTLPGCSEPQGLAFLPGLNRLFVANGGSGELKMYDSETLKVLKRLSPLSDADNVRYDASGGHVYVGYGSGGLAVMDTNGMQLASIPLSGHPESFQLERDGKRIFVNVPGERSVAVVDRAQRKAIANWPLESAHSNFPMALDEANRRLFVGCRSPARLLVLDLTSGKQVAQIEISGDTDDVFFDAKRARLYLSCGEGFLDVIQCRAGDHYERIAREPTRRGARTGYFSAEADRLFLAVPKRPGHDAEIRIYQPSEKP